MIERTLVLIKPDGVQRGIVGEIISRIEKVGLKILAMKMIWMDKNFTKKHYFDIEDRHGKKILNDLISYLTEGPVIAICFEGVNAVDIVRKLVGPTIPAEALPGTIRGDFCHVTRAYANKHGKAIENLIHTSAKRKEAEYELKLWFSVDELHSYKRLDEKFTI